MNLETGASIRALVIDDSAVMRGLLRMTLATCPDIELVGMAEDGIAGIAAVERLKPDLVLLDIEMPRMNGLEALAAIRAHDPRVKVVMCSTLTRRGAGITLEALARGAADYVAKPVAQHGLREGIEALSRELLPKIRALFSSEDGQSVKSNVMPLPVRPQPGRIGCNAAGVVVIGVSTGGPAALEKLLPAFPADFLVPILIVQHMPPIFTALLAERLHKLCRIRVCEAVAGQQVTAGTAYIARGDWHLEASGSASCCRLRLTQAAAKQYCRPSVDVMFRSAAAVYGAGVVAVVLTGMGSDGLEGCRAIRAVGGRILVQDRESSAVWGMPGVVAEAGLADRVLPLEGMAAEVVRSTYPCAGSRPA